MKIISIIIPVHNRLEVTKEGLRELILSLKSHKLSNKNTFNYEIIVVDDGSTDNTSKWLSNNFSNITILKGDGNLWWSGAINLGVKHSINVLSADFVLLWLADIFPQNCFFEQLEMTISEQNGSFILGSMVLDYESENVWVNGGYFNTFTGKRYVLRQQHKSNKITYEVDWLPGMGTLIPSKVISDIGYWDEENFPQYHGDIDYCLRAKNKGITIKVCEKMVIKNKTQYSSFVANDFKGFFKSLGMVQSRYNINKEIKFLYRHTKSPLWIYYLCRKYIGYIYNIINSRI